MLIFQIEIEEWEDFKGGQVICKEGRDLRSIILSLLMGFEAGAKKETRKGLSAGFHFMQYVFYADHLQKKREVVASQLPWEVD